MNIAQAYVPLTFNVAYVIIYSMRDKQQIQATNNPSSLERFSLGFEYDKTLQEVKRDMHTRTVL